MMEMEADYSRKWFTMAATGMGIFLATIDGSIVSVALPTLVETLQTDFSVIQWVVLSYLLTVTTLILSIGRLGDMIGKKSLYAAGFIIFTTGSVFCGLSPSVYWLIGFRMLQAIGSAMIMALGMAIVTEAFPPTERGKAMGISGAIVSVGIATGPSLGGIIISVLSWRWIFLVNFPIGIIGTYMVFKFVPLSKPKGKQKFDYFGAIAMFLSILTLLLGLTLGQQRGFSQPIVPAMFTICLITLIIFIAIEVKIEHPMINLKLFLNAEFTVNLINAFIAFIGVAGTIILFPFYLQNILGYSTILVGLLLCVIPVTLGITSPISGILSDRFSTGIISTIGLFVLLVGFYTTSFLDENTTIVGYILCILPIGFGLGMFQSPNNSSIMGSVSRQHLGVASGLVSVSRTMGQTIGTAVLGALWAGRTFHYAGETNPGGTTNLSHMAQISALNDTFLVVVALIAIGLALNGLKRVFDSDIRYKPQSV